MYRPAAQAPNTSMFFAVRTQRNPAALIPALRAIIRDLDPELPLQTAGTAADLLDRSLSHRRFAMLLMAIFAALALALALVGIYGVMSCLVTQGTCEIAIRMALGAGGWSVVRLLLRHGGLLLACGVLAGLPMSMAVNRLLTAQLFEVTPADPATYTGVTLALVAAGLAACAIPAFRAVRVDPGSALRSE